MLEIYGFAALILFICLTLLWLLSLFLKNASIIDPFWGTGFVIVNAVYCALGDGLPARQTLMTVIVTIWGLRLSLYLLWRNLGHEEDFRYAKWRKDYGEKWWWYSYFFVFGLQGVILMIVSAPLLVAQQREGLDQITFIDGLGVLLFIIGFMFEAGGDWQLAQFKSKPENKGKVMDSGFWRYTRHPNYFGDAVQWWGFYAIAVAAGGWWTIFAPALMTYLLMRVSGVAMLEKTLSQTKPQYADYIRRTNAFFPGMPKEN